MESGSHKLLESAAYKTLHAHGFSRSSSQASLVLTDLLSRYLTLLSTTCAKYAQHAGRSGLSVWDAFGALEELGVGADELSEYYLSEAKELKHYTFNSARRVEDLNEFKAQLADGLSQDREDAIPLLYAPFTPSPFDENENEEREEDETSDEALPGELVMDTDIPPPRSTTPLSRKPDLPHLSTPPLPLSPISNPTSPARKRARTASWSPPVHVPDFLPPFPTTSNAPPSPVASQSPQPTHPIQFEPPPLPLDNAKIDKPPLPLSQPLTSTSASDYLVQVPYSQSSLSGVAEWHLPSTHPQSQPPQPRHPRLPTPQTEPALFSAYHHILTHPPPSHANSPTPSRHKIAMALLSHIQINPRWDPPDTLYSSVAPCTPRVSVIGPTYPMAIGDTGTDPKLRADGKEKEFKFPATIPRPVSSNERLTPLISQQSSRIPDLARHVLPPAILSRTSRLTHPPVLQRGSKHLVYGPGVPAPWNANTIPPSDAIPPTPMTAKLKEIPNGVGGKGGDPPAKPVLPDARLYATWDYEPRDFKVPLTPTARRGRTGNAQSGNGVISLALGQRGRSGSKLG
ncbi:hypothetical protein BDZ94DRAFT_1324056 [Collybia nuda]|uniref:Bromodomain associated domain-containing protein n=1 Tax=Collybia nuda TaxID=64659 RepID=A0A9P6CFQ7_9AGAR|nr:hypothetical protein BDZ94DRAFT_1324056 [Collybia nuda]